MKLTGPESTEDNFVEVIGAVSNSMLHPILMTIPHRILMKTPVPILPTTTTILPISPSAA
jgi:hypothetical protein